MTRQLGLPSGQATGRAGLSSQWGPRGHPLRFARLGSSPVNSQSSVRPTSAAPSRAPGPLAIPHKALRPPTEPSPARGPRTVTLSGFFQARRGGPVPLPSQSPTATPSPATVSSIISCGTRSSKPPWPNLGLADLTTAPAMQPHTAPRTRQGHAGLGASARAAQKTCLLYQHGPRRAPGTDRPASRQSGEGHRAPRPRTGRQRGGQEPGRTQGRPPPLRHPGGPKRARPPECRRGRGRGAQRMHGCAHRKRSRASQQPGRERPSTRDPRDGGAVLARGGQRQGPSRRRVSGPGRAASPRPEGAPPRLPAPRGGSAAAPRAPRGPRGPGALTVRGGAVVPVPGLHDEGEGALRTQEGPSGARGPARRHRAGAAHLLPAPRPQALGSADSRWPPLSRPQDDPPPERGCPWSPSLRGLRVLAPVASGPRLDSPTGSSQQGAQGECPGLPQALAGTQKTATTSAPLTRQQGGRRGPRCTHRDRPRGARCGLGHSLPCSRATGPLTPGHDGRATE